MRSFLLLFCFIILNACSLFDEDSDTNSISANGSDVYYGTELAFTYGEKMEIGSMIWIRSEEISSGTYVYTSTVSATTDDDTTYDDYQAEEGSTEYEPDQQDPLDENPNTPRVSSSDDMTFYMKVKELSTGIALYSVTTSYENAVNSTGYQLYTFASSYLRPYVYE